jgi:peptide/nickel transport system permease protein
MALVAAEREATEARSGSGTLRIMARGLASSKSGLIGVGVVLAVTLFCFVGPLIYPTNQVSSNLNAVNLPPSSSHLLGTSDSGFDILGRLMVGGQTSLEIGISVAIVASVFGVLVGAFAGFFGGIADALVMRVVDTILAVPILFFLLFLASVTTPSVPELILVLSALSWLGPARLIRGETLTIRVLEYVQASRVMGGRSLRILLRHIVPNSIGTIVVNATFQVADAILILATISYLGLGLPPPAATWGGMLSNGTNYISDGYWWEIYPVGLIIVITVIAINFIGDAIRDSLQLQLIRR